MRAIFSNIEAAILEEMTKHTHVLCASGWLTSKAIIRRMQKMTARAVVGEDKWGTDYGTIDALVLTRGQNMMHHKFMVLGDEDGWKVVISGSYNFTENAKGNDENMMVLPSAEMAKEFAASFYELYPQPCECIDHLHCSDGGNGWYWDTDADDDITGWSEKCYGEKACATGSYRQECDGSFHDRATEYQGMNHIYASSVGGCNRNASRHATWGFKLHGANDELKPMHINMHLTGGSEINVMRDVMVWWLLASGMTVEQVMASAVRQRGRLALGMKCDETVGAK